MSSLVLVVLGLAALALGLFIEWPGWWNGVFGLLGAALLGAWLYNARRP